MTAVLTHLCQIKRSLFRCGSEAAGVCQYCGRSFCRDHGVVLADGQEVCSRRFCVAKREDLIRHLDYQALVLRRNERALCGIDGCDSPLDGQCARCKGYFCGRHVHAREDPVLQNGVRVPRMATLCRHCSARRPIWLRV